MKRTFFLTSVFAIGSALATPVDSEVIGVLNAATDSGTRPGKMLVAVPFVGYAADTDVKVTDLIATASLPVGTILRVAAEIDGKNATWSTWRLTSEKAWEAVPAVEIDKNGGAESDAAGGTGLVGRGSSFWLELPDGATQPERVLLLGQKDTKENPSLSLTANQWNLVGNPDVEDFDVLAALAATPVHGDQIVTQTKSGRQVSYLYNNSAWGTAGKTYNSITLKPGEGCWVKLANGGTISFK